MLNRADLAEDLRRRKAIVDESKTRQSQSGPIHSSKSPFAFSMVFRDLSDCRAQCVKAGREWDLSRKRLNAQEVAWLADVLADDLV
jgi:hypothetical protein